MAAYLYANLRITDAERYAAYSREVTAQIAAYGGRFLVRGGATVVLEGEAAPQRQVIVEFPDMERLRSWYASADYQRLLAIRQSASKGTLLAIEGI